MRSSEVFVQPRPAKDPAGILASWCYPNTYEVGMSGLGYQLVWSLMDRHAGFHVKRAFTDIQEAGWEKSELIGFTLSWELDCLNALKMLEKLKVASRSGKRQSGDPVVFGGGPVLTANPEPFADFFDVILLGDAECTVPAFLDRWEQIRGSENRREQLIELSQVEGIYVPSLYTPDYQDGPAAIASIQTVDPRVPARITKPTFTPPPDYIAHSQILTPDTAWGDMFLVEIARSCPQECRFCLASYLTRPFRASNVDAVLNAVDLGLRHTEKIGLLGPSVTEHPQFDRIAAGLMKRPQTQVSIASIRADTIDPIVLEMLKSLGQKTVTIAIESGSERLRAIMKKNLTTTQIEKAVDLIEQAGLEGVKFYGIVGLPGETDEDLKQTVELMRFLKKSHKRLRFVFGVSSFVPKAQTPFQWSARDRKAKQKIEYIRKNLAGAGIKVRPESHNWSDIQTLLSRGDRRLAPVIESLVQTGTSLGAWRKALRNRPESCPDLDYYVFREIPPDEILPWDHLTPPQKFEMLDHSRNHAYELSRKP